MISYTFKPKLKDSNGLLVGRKLWTSSSPYLEVAYGGTVYIFSSDPDKRLDVKAFPTVI